MNVEIIANEFETRAATLLRYFTGLCESSYKYLLHLRFIMILLMLCI